MVARRCRTATNGTSRTATMYGSRLPLPASLSFTWQWMAMIHPLVACSPASSAFSSGAEDVKHHEAVRHDVRGIKLQVQFIQPAATSPPSG